ncbi:MAG: hypothetical protein V3S43_03460 [Acidimicrobiia bacterium]
MSVLIRVVKSPAWVLFWTIWEGAGDAAEIIIGKGGERIFTITQGTLRATVGSEQSSPFADYLAQSPSFARDGFVDFAATTILPIMEGHWIAEARDGPAHGFCHVPLDADLLEGVIGSRRVAEALAAPVDGFDGPYRVHFDIVQGGRIDPSDIGRIVGGRRIIDAEMLEDSALNDLRVALANERSRRR